MASNSQFGSNPLGEVQDTDDDGLILAWMEGPPLCDDDGVPHEKTTGFAPTEGVNGMACTQRAFAGEPANCPPSAGDEIAKRVPGGVLDVLAKGALEVTSIGDDKLKVFVAEGVLEVASAQGAEHKVPSLFKYLSKSSGGLVVLAGVLMNTMPLPAWSGVPMKCSPWLRGVAIGVCMGEQSTSILKVRH